MTEETTNTEAQDSNVNISIEQICAAILNTVGAVEVPMENLVTNYGTRSIAVNQDSETKAVTFTLVENPTQEEAAE